MLPTGNIDDIKTSLNLIKRVSESKDRTCGLEMVELFFLYALRPYYDCMWSGMNNSSYSVMHALALLVPEDIRDNIKVYPKGSTDWLTLSDFIKEANERDLVTLQLPQSLQESFKALL